MVDESIRLTVQAYLRAAREAGIDVREGILFGSHARGEAHEWSDIDLVVIAAEMDIHPSRKLVEKLWELRVKTDSRIEPIACGVEEWETNQDRPILEIARREGIVIAA